MEPIELTTLIECCARLAELTTAPPGALAEAVVIHMHRVKPALLAVARASGEGRAFAASTKSTAFDVYTLRYHCVAVDIFDHREAAP